jgi:protein-histidine N-methyltransferase
MDTLPSRISYSALSVPLDAAAPGGSPRAVPIFRRDLFDARFQVLTSSTEHDDDDDDDDVEEGTPRRQGAAAAAAAAQEEQTHVGAASDLLPGVYEGGLKTWECSLDLVAALDSLDRARTEAAGEAWSWLRGCRVLEVRLFFRSSGPRPRTGPRPVDNVRRGLTTSHATAGLWHSCAERLLAAAPLLAQ